jgi:anti-sigma B factor antagonist
MNDTAPPLTVRPAAVGVSVIEVSGELTRDSEPALQDAYARASDGATAIVLAFDNLDYMNSSGIGLLVTLLVRARTAGQQLHACGLNEHYRHIFELTRLDEAILIHETEDAAVAAASAR